MKKSGTRSSFHPFLCFALLFSLLAPVLGTAQHKYWIFFTDKPRQDFDPYSYFHPSALERRLNNGLPLYDETDLPVNAEYVQQVCHIADSAGHASRWFNAVGVWLSNDRQIRAISKLPFVKEVQQMTLAPRVAGEEGDNDLGEQEMALLRAQVSTMQGSLFARHQINGKGVRIAVFDVGFKHVNTHDAFRHLFNNNRVVATYDFVKDQDLVFKRGKHGIMVLSCIAGKYDTLDMGLATGAEFLLARTERTITEVLEEEDNWVAAAEWADKNGVKIINSSLGYSDKRYFRWDMNGRKSLVARGAAMAARKGILVVNAAGNEATGSWKYLVTPADVDSVLTIGGIDPASGYHIGFSSFGPTADGRRKPNVTAAGHVIVADPDGGYGQSYGTSFATPLITGFAACIWQLHPEYTNMQVFEEIEKAGSLYPYFDYAHGYGVPQASYFLSTEKKPEPTLEIIEDGGELSIKIMESAFDSTMQDSSSVLYYHLADSTGFLLKYALIRAKEPITYALQENFFPRAVVLTAHFRGYTQKYYIRNEE